jgi:alginate O-acetyltransferase complex protein AlgI
MLFHSPPFFVFFAAYFVAQMLVPLRWRLWLIIVGGTVFYGWWDPRLVWVPHLLALIGWAGARWTSAGVERRSQRRRLAVSVSLLLLPLLVFKYANFLYHTLVQELAGGPPWTLAVPLPLGISFVTFTMIAYVVDAYRGLYRVERRASMVSAYTVFFPHLIAGPILRPRELMPQLDRPRPALAVSATLGVAIFTVGLAKKLIFATSLADTVDRVYAGSAAFSACDYLLAIYGFSLQIYCDFSGYTDMAIGLALLLGVRLPNNFDRPYASRSVAEFWRRWHKTLSFWLRDYLYIPLGGNRGGGWFRFRNIMITMVLAGLWHGANWTFALWGAFHGLCIAANHVLRRRRSRGKPPGGARHWAAVAITFHVVTLGWILFRAPNLAVGWRVLSGPFRAPAGDLADFVTLNAFPLALLAIFLLTHPIDTHARVRLAAARLPATVLWPAIALIWAVSFALGTGNAGKFIYFDF